jgi:hypothetical protein
MKDDEENPIFRVDALIDKVTPRQVYEVLREYSAVSNWFGKALQTKILLGVAKDPQEKVFSTIYKGGIYPLKNREIIHRHLTHADESKGGTFVVSFTTLGLENVR